MCPLSRVTASEQVYVQIKKMIAQSDLPPGTPLVAQTLANQMGVSRTPVIEAIRRLERDGLVVTAPRWGANVKEWTEKETYEVYRLRRAVEGEAARLFVLFAKDEDKKKLVSLNDLFDQYSKIGDVDKVDEADLELHLHIVRSTGFMRLYELVESSKIAAIVIYGSTESQSQSPEEIKAANQKNLGCHNALVEALCGTDPEKATRAMWEHLDNHSEYMVKFSGNEAHIVPVPRPPRE